MFMCRSASAGADPALDILIPFWHHSVTQRNQYTMEHYRLLSTSIIDGAQQSTCKLASAETKRSGTSTLKAKALRWSWIRIAFLCSILLTSTACTSTGVPLHTISTVQGATTTGDLPSTPTVITEATPTRIPSTPTSTPTATPTPTTTPTTPVNEPTHTATAVSSTLSPFATSPTDADLSVLDLASQSRLQHILDQLVADGITPGVVLCVTVPGQASWMGASGLADRETVTPMDPTTPFYIGSITKMFTAAIVLQLVEEGRLQLDMPVATWLPDILPQAKSITVRHLLNHTSGLPDYLNDYQLVAEAYEHPEHVWTPPELVERVIQTPPVFEPGAEGQWEYSNTNYVILGMLIERITGTTYAEELQARILDPLELEHTYFPVENSHHEDAARGYVGEVAPTHDMASFIWAAGNMVSTTSDLQRFAQALFTGDLLKPESRVLMLTFVQAYDRTSERNLDYGLGVMRISVPLQIGITEHPSPIATSTVFGHRGGWAGFRSILWYEPEHGIVIALGVNQAQTDPTPIATSILNTLLSQHSQ